MKGVFCIEGFWYGDHRDHTSVYPILDLVQRYNKLPFVHHRCATKEEFIFSIKRWKTKSFHQKYPLLYLGFHGNPGVIHIGKETITVEELGDLLEDKCDRVVIHFGSCSTLSQDARRWQTFMQKTDSVAVMGYKTEIDWMTGASFEIMLLEILSAYPFDSKGVKSIQKEIDLYCRSSAKKLCFRFIENKKVHFPRKRSKSTLS